MPWWPLFNSCFTVGCQDVLGKPQTWVCKDWVSKQSSYNGCPTCHCTVSINSFVGSSSFNYIKNLKLDHQSMDPEGPIFTKGCLQSASQGSFKCAFGGSWRPMRVPWFMVDVYMACKRWIQAGAELGQAQLKLDLGFTSIGICCITLMITN